jgi:DNA-binding GntR family transcriptional regulator
MKADRFYSIWCRGGFMNKRQLEEFKKINPFIPISKAISQILINEIVTLSIEPGSKLNIKKIADDLDVSRTPVVQAANMLLDMNFLTKRDGKNSYYVTELSAEEVSQLFQVWSALEVKAAYLCAELFLDDEIINKIIFYANGYIDVMDYPDPQSSRLMDDNSDKLFHELIINNCDNPYLKECYELIEKKILRYRKMANYKANQPEHRYTLKRIAKQHIIIVNAIRSNIPDLAARAMENHMKLCETYITSIAGDYIIKS